MFTATANDVRVTLECIGEGYNGDYDETDPQDKPLLRFYVERKVGGIGGPPDPSPGFWEDVEDGSYCTSIPEDSPHGQKYAEDILTAVYERVVKGESVKKLAADLSWLGHKGGEGQLLCEETTKNI